MFKRIAGGTVLLGLLLFGQPLRTKADAPPPVVINELLWMGSSASSADEWVELRNPSASPVDLSGWQLTRRSSGVEVLMLTIPSGKSIPGSGYFLIANNAPTTLFGSSPNQVESPLAATPDLVDASVSLLNSGLQLKLYAGVWNAGGTLVDTADDGTGNPLAGAFDSAAGTFASMERNLTSGDGTLGASWHTATRAVGWDLGAVELGTPGATNSAATPIAALSAPTSGTVGQVLSFDASDSIDPEGRPLAFAWTFGDGSLAAGPTATHPFAVAGSYGVQVVVSNGERSATATLTVPVGEAIAAPAPTPPSVIGDFILSELQPAPSADEFVEVVNRGTESADLGGWVLSDGVHRFTVPSGTTVASGAWKAFPAATTGIHWNDDGDTVYLYAPDGSLKDAVRYAKSRPGWSLVQTDGTWAWTDHPSPGTANVPIGAGMDAAVAVAPELPAVGSSSSTSSGGTTARVSATAPIPTVATSDVSELARNVTVRIRGTVTAAPGSVAARTLYLRDTTGGIAVYAATATLPAIALGDVVEVTGRVSHVQRGDRLLVSSTTDIHVLGHGLAPSGTPTSAAELDADVVGSLVTVTGSLVDLTATRITLDDGSGEIAVRRPKGFKGKDGDAVVVQGIVINGQPITLLPRSPEDVRTESGTVAGAETGNPLIPTAKAAGTGQPLTVDAPGRDSTTTALVLFGAAITLGALVLGLLKRFAPHLWAPRRERHR